MSTANNDDDDDECDPVIIIMVTIDSTGNSKCDGSSALLCNQQHRVTTVSMTMGETK